MTWNFPNSTGLAAGLAAVLLGLFLPAGARAQENGQAPVPTAEHKTDPRVWLRIMAFTDAPVVGADIRVTLGGRDGPLLVEAKDATNRQGVFPARIGRPWLLGDQAAAANQPERRRQALLRISISGGTTNGDPFLGHLTADVALTDPAHQILVVNPVTTLVSRLLDARPELKLEEAEALVRRFLKLPENYSLGLALRESSHYVSPFFSPVALMTEARDAGGLNAFAHLLLQELLASPWSTAAHSFRPPKLLGSTGSDATSALQAGLYAGILDFAGSEGVGGLAGWALSLTGLFPTSDTTQNEIDALTGALNDLQSSIDNLSNQVNALTNLVQSTATQEQYNTIVVPAQTLATQVNGVASDFASWASACPPEYVGKDKPNPEPYCTSEKASLNAELNNVTIQQAYVTMENYVKDNPTTGFRGMLHLYSLWLAQSQPFFRPADSTKMQNLYDYWDAALTQAANLKIELLHENNAQVGNPQQLTDFMGNPDGTPQPTTGLFQANQAANLKLLFPPVPVGTVVDTKTRLMWATGMPMLQPYTDSSGNTTCYCPSDYYGFGAPYGLTGSPSFGMSFAGLSGWTSPSLSTLQALINGWSGNASDPMSWLIAQSKAVAPDMPTSSGFFNVLACANDSGTGGLYHFVWTSTNQGSSNPNFYSPYAVLDMGNASIPAKNTYPYGQSNWLMLTRPLAQGEQYYWYP